MTELLWIHLFNNNNNNNNNNNGTHTNQSQCMKREMSQCYGINQYTQTDKLQKIGQT
jgi:hypothetical protein